MSHKFLEPIKIGNQTVKNRVMFLAMAKNISNFDDSVSAKDIAYVESVAAGGVGLLVPGAMIVDPEWPSVLPLQPGIYDDRFIPGLRRLVLAAHKYDAKILFQLWHPGATNYSGIDPKTVDELTKDEIHAIQDKFVAAAKRAMAAGADGIEFQTCHGYLACQFISPLFNHRTDEYGWNKVEDRTRFATEILTRIRKVIGPDKIISVKMQGFDYPKSEGPNGNDGITPEQAAEVAPYLEKAGADMIAVSAGGTIYHQDDIMSGDVHRAEGWKVPAATMVKNAVSVPVVATGSIRHPDFVDQIINDGKCDMVGMGRGAFARNRVGDVLIGEDLGQNLVDRRVLRRDADAALHVDAGRFDGHGVVLPLIEGFDGLLDRYIREFEVDRLCQSRAGKRQQAECEQTHDRTRMEKCGSIVKFFHRLKF